MSLQWREIDLWPSRDIVKFYSPSDFRVKFPATRALMDGTECPIKKPKAPAAQQIVFSTYKNRCTAKTIIGSTPGGMVSYVSPAYGGSASDRQIIERSKVPEKCDPSDSLMADKGFDVQDIFAPYDVTINIPTFFKKQNKMSGKTVLKDRKIASKRVHIERIIGLGKTYKILNQPMNYTETLLASDIIFICYMLVNIRPCIVSPDAWVVKCTFSWESLENAIELKHCICETRIYVLVQFQMQPLPLFGHTSRFVSPKVLVEGMQHKH